MTISVKNLKFNFLLLFFASLVFVSCDKDDDGEADFVGATSTYSYEFHNGQTVPSAPYDGLHPSNFSADIMLTETEDDLTMITVTLKNTIEGETYHLHAHDSADAATTPNGTPYNESPNTEILAQMVVGNGGTVTVSQQANASYDFLTGEYSGFFVVHDPLQDISTVNINTYLIVGSFAREQAASGLASTTFDYAFNTGQLVEDFAYTGTHSTDLSASITVTELADNRSRVTVSIMNAMDGMTYNTHAHDMADAATTPNGTPYIETPNSGIFAASIMATGNMATATNISDTNYEDITTMYDGFFVVHDPLQDISTTDPTTYVILGVFAR